MKNWPRVRLGEVASICRRPVDIDINAEYPELGIRSFGKGTFQKRPVAGADVGSKKLFEIKPGDLVFSNVFAWEGAVAVAKPEDDGRFGSHRFIACVVDNGRADAKFLCSYLTSSEEGLDQIRKASPGGAGRNRTLGLEKLVEITVPLPPLPEQRAIVAKLDELSDKTTQLNAHLDAIEADADALVLSLHNELSGSRTVALSDVIELYEESVAIESDMSYPQVGIRSFGCGLFAKPAITGAETTYRSFNCLYEDAFVLSQVKGWEGAIALTPPELVGMYASPEYRTFRCLPGRASPQYLVEIIKRPWFWSLLQDATRGVGARRERTRPEQFLNVVLPMPEYDRQLEGAQIFKNLAALRAKHATIRQSNATLVPATLERIFGEHRAPAAESSGTATDLRLHSDVGV
ncbi:restriction endonuclease subunit S [Paraburkholderia sp. MM6662-R1]|uniref:restriction endonuclease subunit S n=1 Tax=Paraburkholderia sp. MM6662-R1 TaxID=2991066 RepID=UPI003D19B960